MTNELMIPTTTVAQVETIPPEDITEEFEPGEWEPVDAEVVENKPVEKTPEVSEQRRSQIEKCEQQLFHLGAELHRLEAEIKQCKAAIKDQQAVANFLSKPEPEEEDLGPTLFDPENPGETRLDSLDFTPGVIKSLHEAGLHTVADVGAYTERGELLTDIPGIGVDKAEKIIEALAKVNGIR